MTISSPIITTLGALVTMALIGCVHEVPGGTVEITQVTQVTQVNQFNQVRVSAPTTVHVHHGRPNCERMCWRIQQSCNSGCRPGAWSSNMRAIQDHCESGCRFGHFGCVADCRRDQR